MTKNTERQLELPILVEVNNIKTRALSDSTHPATVADVNLTEKIYFGASTDDKLVYQSIIDSYFNRAR